MARFQPLPPDLVELRAALRGNQADINRFSLANEGLLPPQEFYNPENIGRIMSDESRAGRA
jgi:hypothetical protein